MSPVLIRNCSLQEEKSSQQTKTYNGRIKTKQKSKQIESKQIKSHGEIELTTSEKLRGVGVGPSVANGSAAGHHAVRHLELLECLQQLQLWPAKIMQMAINTVLVVEKVGCLIYFTSYAFITDKKSKGPFGTTRNNKDLHTYSLLHPGTHTFPGAGFSATCLQQISFGG